MIVAKRHNRLIIYESRGVTTPVGRAFTRRLDFEAARLDWMIHTRRRSEGWS
jgi:hypothetical protein